MFQLVIRLDREYTYSNVTYLNKCERAKMPKKKKYTVRRRLMYSLEKICTWKRTYMN